MCRTKYLHRAVLALFFLAGLSCNHATAQPLVLPFHQLTVADNLTAQSFNDYIFTDSEGFVWISSIDGLNRYDGQSVIRILPGDIGIKSLQDGNIQGGFFEDKNTNVWFGTNNAIHCYHRAQDEFLYYQIFKDEKSVSNYKLLYIDNEKRIIWLAVADDLYWFSIDQPEKHHLVCDYYLSGKTLIVEDENSNDIFLFSPLNENDGIGKLTLRKAANYEINSTDTLLAGKHTRGLYYEDKNNLWVVGKDGLFRINTEGHIFNKQHKYNDTAIKSMYDLVEFNEDELLVITKDELEGTYIFNKQLFRFTHQIYSSQNNVVQPLNLPMDAVVADSFGNFWFTITGQGIVFTNPGQKKIEAFLQSQSGRFSAQSNIQGITEDRSGNIWCLAKDGILVIDSTGQQIPEFEDLANEIPPYLKNDIYSIFCDGDDYIWICAFEGLFRYDKNKNTFKRMKTANGIELKRVPFGKTLSNNQILISSFDDHQSLSTGLFVVQKNNSGAPTLQNVKAAKTFKDINYFYEDDLGNLYLCEYSRSITVGKLLQNQFVIDTTILLKGMVTGMVKDNQRNCLWITSDDGLYQLLMSGGQYQLTISESFTTENLKGVLYDELEATLWISSTSGLYLFDPNSGMSRSFSTSEGLQAPEFNFYSAFKTRAGKLAFGGINGLNLIDPVRATRYTSPIPKPKITNIQINNEPDTTLNCELNNTKNVSQFKTLKLPYYKNTISFNFAALDYSDPSANQFRYRMLGVDEGWVENGTKNFTRYPNLREGKYTFEIQASSAEGVWPSEEQYANHTVMLDIEVRPPIWRTWWAYILYALTGIGLISWWYTSRINRIKKEEEFKRKEAEFKQKEAEYKQLVAETETAVLRLQMNPHFIFNSMNSISSYIANRDIDTANAYLNRFAKLMRSILKLGKQGLIPVADEIDLLDQYLKTEAMRFERKFSYDFEVAPEVDEDETVVPTMILQPFVENAIWHGLSARQGKGMILIRFWKEEAALKISIEDNGIGRKAAKELKQNSFKSHKSQALEITRNRLQVLAEKEGQQADFYFEDITDAEGNPSGTRVIIVLPLL